MPKPAPIKRIGITDPKVRIALFGNGEVAIVRRMEDTGMYRLLYFKNGKGYKKDIPATDWSWRLQQSGEYGVRYLNAIEQEGVIDAIRDVWEAVTKRKAGG